MDGVYLPDAGRLQTVEDQVEPEQELVSAISAAFSPVSNGRLRSCNARPAAGDLVALSELIESGQVTPAIDRTYPLGETVAAIRHLLDGHARGKVVIGI